MSDANLTPAPEPKRSRAAEALLVGLLVLAVLLVAVFSHLAEEHDQAKAAEREAQEKRLLDPNAPLEGDALVELARKVSSPVVSRPDLTELLESQGQD